ncbi:MAG: tRNA uridine-5-carboxymethylaminomethyl(34) synthesis GTPase MnmE [Clostridia bacterium]|nr:tRNA uridine-5-carboxymethylaminomethyl(34) synthesis GTPase MnmE [Clostridia bacterium]
MHTIAALATAGGKGGIAVIRLSGDDCIEIASKVFKPFKTKLCDAQSNMQIYGEIVGSDGVRIDTGLATVFRAPHSYTGENTVEISCHGSPVGVSLILTALFESGAEHALPGEYTKRAFVNGKLDLTQAEAVGELIDAESTTAHKLFSAQLSGSVGKLVREQADEITHLLASLYAYIDYPDEDMTDIPEDQLKERLLTIKKKLQKLTNSYSTGLAITEGVKSAIVGLPNTGKSSLLNALLGFDRAIVTDIAGTTRDVVTESVIVGGIKLCLSDTAGLHETDDTVEKIGVERSKAALDDSSLVFGVFDVSENVGKDEEEIAKLLVDAKEDKNVIVVLNKCDKNTSQNHEEYFKNLGFDKIVSVSAKSGDGMERIEDAVKAFYPDVDSAMGGEILANARQHSALTKAVSDIDKALVALEALTPDTACLDMESALGELLEADGRQVSEEIVNNIFAHFCVGK